MTADELVVLLAAGALSTDCELSDVLLEEPLVSEGVLCEELLLDAVSGTDEELLEDKSEDDCRSGLDELTAELVDELWLGV